MTDEAYRAVFLRVHPTGKMVLSLTTESDAREREYAELVGDHLRVLPLVAVGIGGQAEHHLAGGVHAQEHRSVGRVGHH